jgi:hypothetical protein
MQRFHGDIGQWLTGIAAAAPDTPGDAGRRMTFERDRAVGVPGGAGHAGRMPRTLPGRLAKFVSRRGYERDIFSDRRRRGPDCARF